MNGNSVVCVLFAVCCASLVNSMCPSSSDGTVITQPDGCKRVCLQGGSANFGRYLNVANNPGNIVTANLKCGKFEISAGPSANVLNVLSSVDLPFIGTQSLAGTIAISSTCPNQRTTSYASLPFMDGLFVQTIYSKNNQFGLAYSCASLLSIVSESIALVIREDQLANVEAIVADANAWLAQSSFSNLHLVKNNDVATCF